MAKRKMKVGVAEKKESVKISLLKEKNGKIYTKRARLESDIENFAPLLEKTRWKILKILAQSPTYPAELAKRLGIHEQSAYYHIKQLEKANLIRVMSKQEVGGALAKIYTITDSAFALELPTGEESLAEIPMRTQSLKLKRFLHPFIHNGKLQAEIVVGSPDPHGPHQVRARDGHHATDLALFLGQWCSTPQELVTKLDVDVKAQGTYSKNMILLGGILTNILTADINKFLSVKFQTEHFPFRSIISEKTGKVYDEENIGIVAKIVNPFSKDKSLLVLAGNTYSGTLAAIIALTRFTDELLKNYKNEDNWATVVQGLDMDGDGKIDQIKILE